MINGYLDNNNLVYGTNNNYNFMININSGVPKVYLNKNIKSLFFHHSSMSSNFNLNLDVFFNTFNPYFVEDANQAFYGCNITGNIPLLPNCLYMMNTYENCYSFTGTPKCGDRVVNFSGAYFNCGNLTGPPVCGPNVVNFDSTYHGCQSLTGSPVCGVNVVCFSGGYYDCPNLTGSPVCGPNVNDMSWAYTGCYRLSGAPVCGENVVTMYDAYEYCWGLTGAPVIGPKVVNASYAYSACSGLTATTITIPPTVKNYNHMFNGCSGLFKGPDNRLNVHLYANEPLNYSNLPDINYMFYGKKNNQLLVFHTVAGSSMNYQLYQSNAKNSVIGKTFTWSRNSTQQAYWNSVYNIYVFYDL